MRPSLQLQDPDRQAIYSIDRRSFLFKIQKDNQIEEIRLSPFYSAVLGVLFSEHPVPVPYSSLKSKLKQFNMACPDVTRLHRRISELRQELQAISSDLSNVIHNIRGVGYSLPLNWRSPDDQVELKPVGYRSHPVLQIMHGLEALVQESIHYAGDARIVKSGDYYVQDRKLLSSEIEELVSHCNSLEKDLLSQLSLSPADFHYIRIQLGFASLRSYIGLCRMCDSPITHSQWKGWHAQEVRRVFAELQSLVKDAEKIAA